MMAQVWNRVEKETAEALTPVEPALSVENVSHAYGARLALDDVSFTVPCGSFTVLLGLNGAGKSTLFSLITRLYQIRQGVIRVLGHVRDSVLRAVKLPRSFVAVDDEDCRLVSFPHDCGIGNDDHVGMPLGIDVDLHRRAGRKAGRANKAESNGNRCRAGIDGRRT